MYPFPMAHRTPCSRLPFFFSLALFAAPLMAVHPDETRGIEPEQDLLGGRPFGKPDVAVNDAPFATATALVVEKAGANYWDRQSAVSLPEAITKGDTLLVVFYMRCTDSDGANKLGAARILVEQTGTWKNILDKRVTVGRTWTRFAYALTSPMDLPARTVNLAVQAGTLRQTLEIGGVAALRFPSSVKPESLTGTDEDAPLSLRKVANMAYADAVAGDGKGGWSDQGPENDLAGFPGGRLEFMGIRFDTLPVKGPEDPAVITFKSRHLQSGLGASEAALFPPEQARANQLYLLHTTCWAGKTGDAVGTVTVLFEDGREKSFDVRQGRDVADWWRPIGQSNGLPVWSKPNRSEKVGLYLSRFDLGPRPSRIRRVTLATAGASIWIVVGATLSTKALSFDMPPWTAEAGKAWKAVAMDDLVVQPGSALDFSAMVDGGPAGRFGRVRLNDAGKMVFEKDPNRILRFFGASIDGGVVTRDGANPTKEDIDRWCQAVRLQGYNLARPHFLDHFLMQGAKADLEWDEARLDLFWYMVHALKTNGIYLYLDAMTSWAGYLKGSGWGSSPKTHDLKTRMYFDPAARSNWILGVRRLFTTVNPYTGTTLASDPQVAVIVFLNEQEINQLGSVRTPWTRWLEARYTNRENLARAWTDGKGRTFLAPDETFATVPWIPGEPGPRGVDAGLFLYELNRDMARWFHDEIRAMGYSGLVSQFDCYKDLAYSSVRGHLPTVSMHAYHAHPNGYDQKGATVDQESSLSDAAGWFRSMAGTRYLDRPFLVTEYGHVFWNRTRREEGFVVGAYGALQGYDTLMAHAGVVKLSGGRPIAPFRCGIDPVARAAQVVASLLYHRGDVAPAPHRYAVELSASRIFGGAETPTLANKTLGGEHTRLALVTGLGLTAPHLKPMDPVGRVKVDGTLDLSGTASVENTTFASRTVEGAASPFSAQDFLETLKAKGLLPKANRTQVAKGIFESETGEILLDKGRQEIHVVTPRFAGAALRSNAALDLGPLRIQGTTVDSAVAVASLDGKALSQSGRLLLVLITDALNEGMTFDSPERVRLEKIGGPVTLLETTVARLRLRHDHPATLKLTALSMNGARGAAIPVTVDGNDLVLTIDTAALPGGPTVFFELAGD